MSERSRTFRSSFHGRLMVGGYLLAPVTLGVLVVILRVLGGRPPSRVLALLVQLSAVMVIAALLLWWSDRFVIPAIALAVFLFLGGGLLGTFGLSHPDSFFDFVTAIVTMGGPAVVIVAGIRTLALRRRHGLSRASPRQRLSVRIALIALIVVIGMSGGMTYARRANLDAPPGASVVETVGDRFSPSEFSFEEGPHTILVVNRDSYAHTFSVDELELDVYIGPRADRLITFDVPDDPGRHDLYCAVTGHEDMTGTIEFS